MTTRCRECGKSWAGHRPEHCTVCHETFGGTYTGDLHRRGEYGDDTNPRRCVHPLDVGLRLSDKGVWVRPRPEALAAVA